MTVEEILAHVRDLPPEDQARLRAALAAAEERGATTHPSIAPDVQQMLAGHTADEFLVPPSGTVEDARALLRSWNEGAADDLDEGEESWDDMLRSLDAHRFSTRLLFPELVGEQ
jgi:hypothetical protein